MLAFRMSFLLQRTRSIYPPAVGVEISNFITWCFLPLNTQGSLVRQPGICWVSRRQLPTWTATKINYWRDKLILLWNVVTKHKMLGHWGRKKLYPLSDLHCLETSTKTCLDPRSWHSVLHTCCFLPSLWLSSPMHSWKRKYFAENIMKSTSLLAF